MDFFKVELRVTITISWQELPKPRTVGRCAPISGAEALRFREVDRQGKHGAIPGRASQSCSNAQQILSCGQLPVTTAKDRQARQRCCSMNASPIAISLLPPRLDGVGCQRGDLEARGPLSQPLNWHFEEDGGCTALATAQVPTFDAHQVRGHAVACPSWFRPCLVAGVVAALYGAGRTGAVFGWG